MRNYGSCFGLIVCLMLAGAVWWIIEKISFGHTLAFFVLVAAAFVVWRVRRKIRRLRKRAEANAGVTSGRLSGAAAHLQASKPGRSQSELDGRLHGIRDGKQAKRIAASLGTDPALVFNTEPGTDQRWIRGYREGIASILPDAIVQPGFKPQKGTTIL